MLSINNLNVSVDENQILKDLNLKIGIGEVHAIMGPNGSGKSTIAHTLAGKFDYQVQSGSVSFKDQNLLEMDPSQRSLAGLFLAFQYPIELPGVTNASYLKQILNTHRKHNGNKPMEAGEFLKILKEKSNQLNIPMEMHSRFVNAGFSGGEKKKNEILQMAILKPVLSILDETDSGLDIDALRIVADGVNKLNGDDNALILITHYQRLLDHIKPDFVHVISGGKIIKSGGKELAHELEAQGYDWLTTAN